MIIPVITSLSREVMSQTPRDACEAALALGGTRWGMITDVVLPFSRSGMVGATLLGLSRALGETIVVLLMLSSSNRASLAIMGPEVPAPSPNRSPASSRPPMRKGKASWSSPG